MILFKLIAVILSLLTTHAPAHASRSYDREPLQATAAYKVWLDERLDAPQNSCVESLWFSESRWDRYATNNSTGAYGIPQALPAWKMQSAGADWQTNGYTQMEWGLQYIKERYDTACEALNHFNLHGWY